MSNWKLKPLNILFLVTVVILLCSLVYIELSRKAISTDDTVRIKQEYANYEKNVKKFDKIQVSELTELISKQEIIVYFGRKTCPYCRVFVEHLNREREKSKVYIYYVDTEDRDDLELKAVRAKYNIEYVPTLLKLDSSSVQVFDSDNGDLKTFLKGF